MTRTSPDYLESWSHVVDTSELQWVGMLKHLLELNTSITLLPMRKMLISDYWLFEQPVYWRSWSWLLPFVLACIQVALYLKLYLSFRLRLFAFCLVLQFPWRSGLFLPHSTLCHGFSLCFAILLLAWTFDLLTSTFLGSCPSIELLIWFWLFELCHSTMAPVVGWISIWGRWNPLFIWASRNLKLALWDICSAVKLIANCVRGSGPVMKGLRTRQLKKWV